MVRYITVVKGVESFRTVREIGHYFIHDVSIVIKPIKSRHFLKLARRQKCRDILSMPTDARCEPDIRKINDRFSVLFFIHIVQDR